MPNPIRLHRLIALREAAGLTQADMAQRCGLHGNQSRKAVSAWEVGKTIPHASRRVGFMRYLWYDLHLHQNPAAFAELWDILVEEWAWEALEESELAQLQRELTSTVVVTPAPEPDTVDPPVINASEPLPSPLLIAPPLPDSPLPQSTAPYTRSWPTILLRRRNWLLAGLSVLAIIAISAFWWPGAPLPQPTPPPSLTARPTSAPVALVHGGFEGDDGFGGWGVYEECDYQLASDEARAQQGVTYLTIANRRPRCYSFYQDLPGPVTGNTYHAAIWLRAPTGQTRRGRLTLWALADDRKESGQTFFAVDDANWNCLETAIAIKQPGYAQLRLEIYLDSHDGLDYHFDNAVVSQGTAPLCPPPQLTIRDLQLAQPSGKIYPGATVGIEAVVENVGPTAQTTESYLRYWLAAAENGDPVASDGAQVLTIPPLAPGDRITVPQVDLYLPLNLPTEPTYYLVADIATTADPADFHHGMDRVSHVVTVTPCEQGTLYCDVPADHWAAPEIQAWYDAGISQGCRSYTEPFLNRPFCPDAAVQRWMMVFFLLRRLEGNEYQPTAPYQGLFEDVPEEFDSHNGARWIEALVSTRVDMRSEACPPRGEHQHFCPHDLLRRVDFIRALAELQRWEVSAVAGTRFTDLAAGSQDARIAEYMAQQGYLPQDDVGCPTNGGMSRFCPTAPLRRAAAAVIMSRALGLVDVAR